MTTEELKEFIEENIPTFIDISILKEGEAFHYTTHANEIIADDYFLGAPINNNLDRTQLTVISPPAEHANGVVFAYESLQDSTDEAYVASGDREIVRIIRITFSSAVRALHSQEHASSNAPHTILVLAENILDFELVDI